MMGIEVDVAAVMAIDELRNRRGALDDLPLPGGGRTRVRWFFLAEIARCDLSVARLAEGHADARAILEELGRSDLLGDGCLLGVWAADPKQLVATPDGDAWRLEGTKGWCSGSTGIDAALVTATAPDGPRLFLVDTCAVVPQPGSWEPMGMAATRSETMTFAGVRVDALRAVGGPDAYVQRPGFGHGGCGVAACWWGGALGVLDGLRAAVADGGADPGALGRAHAEMAAAGHALAAAADAIDAAPDDEALAIRTAAEIRIAVAGAARRALDEAVGAMGASGLCHRPEHSGRVADMLVYLAQHKPGSAVDHGVHLATETLDPTW